MNKQAIYSILSGTILLFIWNAVSWMVLPFHSNTLHTIPESVIQPAEALREAMPESGVYHYPGLPEGNSATAMEEIEAKLAEGPRITLMVYKNEPTELFELSSFIFSAVANLLTALIVFLIISRLGVASLRSAIVTCLLIGSVAAIVSDISQMNWYMFPLDYTLINVVDKLVAFGLLGLVFGWYVRKKAVGG